ncbi:MAG: hypothetical protein KIPDCIKN_00230 [Haliscomenobacter sp.]|jgi:hypothetical protein|nr:hypothetical protein [Haliscomenobacter sp.]
MWKSLLVFFFLSFCVSTYAQQMLDKKINRVFAHSSLEDALYVLLDQDSIPLVFSNDLLPPKDIFVAFRNTPLREALDFLLDGTGLGFQWVRGNILIQKLPAPVRIPRYTISGYLEDEESGEKLINGSVWAPALETGSTTNGYGFFSLTLPAGAAEIEAAYLGYQSRKIQIGLARDTFVNFPLRRNLTLEEVLITDLDSSLFNKEHSAVYLNPQRNAALPQLVGSNDLVRTVHLLPGVQTGSDGVGGFFVRGGNAGQNQILIDGAMVYNYQHAAGLWSVFHPETVKSAKFIRGEFPARYGGRLSSILDVRLRDGNAHAFHGSVDLGLSSAQMLLEGPVVKGKSAFLFSARTSLVDLYLKPYTRAYKEGQGEDGQSNYQFYDLSGKAHVVLSPKDKLFYSFFSGEDRFGNSGEKVDTFAFRHQDSQFYRFRLRQAYAERLTWRNTAQSLRWTRVVHPRLFMHTLLTSSDLRVEASYNTRKILTLLFPGTGQSADWQRGDYVSRIQDWGGRTEWEWTGLRGTASRAGILVNRQAFSPGVLDFGDEDDGVEAGDGVAFRRIQAWSASAYGEQEVRMGSSWRLDYGMHWSNWWVDRRHFSALEPRIAIYRQLSESLQARAALTRMVQYQHLLSGADIGLPTDLWVPATGKAPPSSVWQQSAGLDWRLNRYLDLSADIFSKSFSNLAAYSEGATFLDDWERNITVGSGASYGAELLVNKRKGKWGGWLSYSLSRTTRQFPLVNQGEAYPFKYDRRHDLKLVIVQAIGKRAEWSAVWVYGSGLAISLPVDAFTVTFSGLPTGPVTVIDFGEKNRLRLPAYHRLDLGLSYRLRSLFGADQNLRIGLYNAYNRKNPLYYQLKTELVVENSRLTEKKSFVGVQLLPVLPSLSYSLRF